MVLSATILAGLLAQCIPTQDGTQAVHPDTMRAIVQVESGGNPNAVYNNTTGQTFKFKNRASAVRYVVKAIRAGDSVDMGIAQVNSKNLFKLRQKTGAPWAISYTMEPCANLWAGAFILHGNYQQALAAGKEPGVPALQHALSAYNTGSLTRGGLYVRKILAAARSPFALENPLRNSAKPAL